MSMLLETQSPEDNDSALETLLSFAYTDLPLPALEC